MFTELQTDLDRAIIARREQLQELGRVSANRPNHPVAAKAWDDMRDWDNAGLGCDPIDAGWPYYEKVKAKQIVVNNFYAESGAKIKVKQVYK